MWAILSAATTAKTNGCLDGVLVKVADDLAEVYFIGLAVKEIIETSTIVAIGPAFAIVPRF